MHYVLYIITMEYKYFYYYVLQGNYILHRFAV